MKTLKFFFSEFYLRRAIFLSLLVHLIIIINGSGLYKKPLLTPPPPELQIIFQKLDNQVSEPNPKPTDVPKAIKDVPKPVIKKIEPLPEEVSEIPITELEEPTPEEPTPEASSEPEVEIDQSQIPESDVDFKNNADFKNEGEVALNEFSNLLARHIAKFKMYPKIAQMRRWQGLVVVDLQLSQDGQLASSKVIQGSGFDLLDKESLEMVKRASPFPVPPEILKNRSFSIIVPIQFKLE